MASREVGKNSGKVVNRLASMNMDLTLSEYQVSRLKSGCSSLPVNKDLVAVGMAHTIYKSLKEEENGDIFTRYVSIKYPNTDDSLPNGPPAKKGKREDSLFGPVQKLHPDWTRVVILKQTATPDGEVQGDEKEYYVHCLYDLKNACFVDERGNCLYVKRDQLLAQPYFPLHVLYILKSIYWQ